ncbi:hypothetical protein D3C77_527250 [compost metagenome]
MGRGYVLRRQQIVLYRRLPATAAIRRQLVDHTRQCPAEQFLYRNVHEPVLYGRKQRQPIVVFRATGRRGLVEHEQVHWNRKNHGRDAGRRKAIRADRV